MPTYVYHCPNDHEIEVNHSIAECDTIQVICPECGSKMHRRPQRPAQVIMSGVIFDWMNYNYAQYRAKRPRFSPDLVKRPGRPIAGTESHYR